MRSSNLKPDEMVLSTIISACGQARNLSYGKAVHYFITENDVVIDTYLQSALITMYASCGSMVMAQQLFANISPRNLVALTAMVSGYSGVGRVEGARLIFNQMDEKDLVCWSAMISGYAESDRSKLLIYLIKCKP